MTLDPRDADWLDVQEPDLSAALRELRELQRERRSFVMAWVLGAALVGLALVAGVVWWLR